jgi:hypothetical protein
MRCILLALALAGCTRPSPHTIDCQSQCTDPSGSGVTGTNGTGGGSTSSDGGSTTGSDGSTIGPSDGSTIGPSDGSTTGPSDGSTIGPSDGGTVGSDGATTGTSSVPMGGLCLGSAMPPSTTDDCVAGDICTVSEGVRQVNLCRQTCHLDGDCKQTTFPGGVAPFCEGASATAAGACSISCDPVGNQGCGSGLACYAVTDRTRPSGDLVITDCASPGAGVEGSDCSGHGTVDCAPSYVCVNFIVSICRVLCLANSDCPSGESCRPFFNVSTPFGWCSA